MFEVLHRHGAALCVHDLIEHHPRVRTADWTYVRFHGPDAVADAYHGRYGRRLLYPWARWAREILDDGDDVFLYFNNDYDGNAVRDAETLRSLLAVQP